ncbi:MAG TPA: CxxxxCH/CxxCH domain-containing protein [Polyangiales bacterium]|nr:CxxxxCH/CxxCH domain-containing protein [Polyangiales bacterium]
MWRHLAFTACLYLLTSACQEERAETAPEPVYAGDLEHVLQSRCERCHGEEDAGAGYRVDSYASTLGCPSSDPERRAVDPGPDGGPAILEVLERPDHADLLESDERVRLSDWVKLEVALRYSAVHTLQISNSRSSDWHGKLAAVDHFAPLRDAENAGVCGRCHRGAPVTPEGVNASAPGAPACTQCHTQPEGVLACGTCHGDGAARAYPPRDVCLFGSSPPDAHRAHVESTRLRSQPLACTTCHPATEQLGDTHANGEIDVVLADGTYDPQTGKCSVGCHNQGGARPEPTFHEAGPLGCNDCHGSPPKQHYAGPCNDCHAGVNASGTELINTALHMNGRVDVGDGGGECGACHGKGSDPMPQTSSHQLHRATQLTREVTCTECHVVPQTVDSPGHLDHGESTPADVVFGARATARAQPANIEAHTCRAIACHGAGLPEGIERALVWDAPAAGGCGGCHGVPPTVDHPRDKGCASLTCHGEEVTLGGDPPAITPAGRNAHIDGAINSLGL